MQRKKDLVAGHSDRFGTSPTTTPSRSTLVLSRLPASALIAMLLVPTFSIASEPVLERHQETTSPVTRQVADPQQAIPPATSTAPPDSVSPTQGTAAAPDMRPEGSPGSRPAGAAIAAAKQRRAHTFAIRVGLLVGAGIAIGTVVALTAGSSSRPN